MIRLLLLGAAGIVLSSSVTLAGSVKLSDMQMDALSGGISGAGSTGNQPGGTIPTPAPPPTNGNNLRTDVHTLFIDLHNHASFSVLQGDLHVIRSDFRSFWH